MARALLYSRRQVYVLTLYATRCRTTPPIHGGPKAGRDPHSQGTQLCLKAMREPALRCRLRNSFCGACRGRNPLKIAARGKFGNSHGDWHHELRPV